MTHPTKEELIEFAYGELSEARRVDLESHLRSCAECGAVVSKWRMAATRMDEWTLPVPRKRRAGIRAMPLAIAAIAVGFALVSAVAVGSLLKEVRDLKSQLASRPGVTRAELTEVMSAVESRHQEQRATDQRTYLAALKQIQARNAEVYAGLRKELETVAVFTEAGLEQTRNQIATIADPRLNESSQQQ